MALFNCIKDYIKTTSVFVLSAPHGKLSRKSDCFDSYQILAPFQHTFSIIFPLNL